MIAIINTYNKIPSFIIQEIDKTNNNIKYFEEYDKDGWTPGFTTNKKTARKYSLIDAKRALYRLSQYWKQSCWWITTYEVKSDFSVEAFEIKSNPKYDKKPELGHFYFKIIKY